jgi:hypothetical protein
MRHACKILVGKPEGKRPFGRPKRGWEYNIGIGFREVGWESVNRMHLAQDRDQWRALVTTVMNFVVL